MPINCPRCGREFVCTCRPSTAAVGSVVEPCVVKPGGIWAQVIDQAGDGVPGVKVSVDGSVKVTDSSGFASWDPMSPKTYQARLEPLTGQLQEKYRPPATDTADATVRAGAVTFVSFTLTPNQELTWIEIVLLGEDNSPVGGVKYRVKLPNAEVREGSLDGSGKARIDKIPPGQCEVSFPDLDRDAWSMLQ